MDFPFFPSRRRLGAPEFTVRRGATQPDIVLFLTDEQRHDEVGYASGGHYETPALDAIAARGTVFERAYSGGTVCVPSRACLLTGLSYERVPLEPGSLSLREGHWTIARALGAAGYQTALVGKMHFSPMYARHGFDVMKLAEHLVPFSGYGAPEIDDYHRFLMWQGRADSAATHMFGPGLDALGEEYAANHSAVKFPHDASLHPIGWIASTAKEVIRNRKPGVPLFLVVSFPRPHTPYDPAEPYASMYDPEDARLPIDDFAANARLPEAFLKAFAKNKGGRHVPQLWADIPEPMQRHIFAYVRALIRQIDDAMASILEDVDTARSVLFFTSDHGTYDGHRGLLGKVPWLPFDDLALVPFACSAPGAVGGQRVSVPVQAWDFALTCLDYAGIVPPPGVFDSVSLRPILEGARAPDDRVVFTGGRMALPMVRRRHLKLIRDARESAELLFDLERDPGETVNVSEDPRYGPEVSELRAALARILARPPIDLPAPA